MRDLKTAAICAYCGMDHKVDRVSLDPDHTEAPATGDLSFCTSCGNFNIVAPRHRGGMRKPTVQEDQEIRENTDCVQLFVRWAQYNKQRARN